MIAIATLVFFATIGFAVALAIPSALPRFVAGRVAAIFLLGAGACGSILFAAGVAGFAVSRPAVVALWIVALGVALVARRASRRLVKKTRLRGDVHEVLSTMVIVAPFALLTWTTGILPLSDYDGRTTWIAKANAIAHDGSIDGPFFRGERGLNLHNRYPLLMPLDASATMLLSSRDDSYRALYALLPAALLLALRDLLSRRHGSAAASWCVAAAAWLPQVAVAPEGGASSAYSDLALAAFAGMAVATLAARGRRASSAAGLWVAFAILTKNEGTMLAIALLVALCLCRPGWRAIARFLAAPAVAFALLEIWRRSIPEAYDERNVALLAELPGRIGRIDDALLAMARHAFDWSVWGAFWPVVMIACVVVPFAPRRRSTVLPLATLVLAFGGYVAALACTSWSIDELARVAANRLLVHCLVPALAIVVVFASTISGRGESGKRLDGASRDEAPPAK